jgi:hypothetical protein
MDDDFDNEEGTEPCGDEAIIDGVEHTCTRNAFHAGVHSAGDFTWEAEHG